MLAIHCGSGADLGLLFLKGDGLVFIVDISVRCYFNVTLVQGFKHHHGDASKGAGVQGIGQFHGARLCFGSELYLSGDLLLTNQQRLTGGLVHQDTRHLVGFARSQTRVGHLVHNGDFPGGGSRMLAIYRSSSADLRSFCKGYSLSLIFNLCVRSYFLLTAVQGFKNNY